METRKIYVSGGSTYVISLPKKWVKREKLKAGDSIAVKIQEGSIILEPAVGHRETAVAEVSVKQLDSADALRHLLIAYYLVGYDTIRVKLDSSKSNYRETLRQTLDYLIGAEVLEDTGDAITVEVLLDPSRMQTLQALQRIHVICKSMLADVIKTLKNRDTNALKDISTREREIDRLYFLVVRQLKSAVRYQQISDRLGIKNQRDSLGYRIVVKSFERIADHLNNISQNYIAVSGGWREYGDFAELVGKIYTGAAKAFFSRDKENAEKVFKDVRKLERQRAILSNQLFQGQTNVQDVLAKRAVLDSLSRIADYSSDISEITINMSIEVP
jgi:phosphate uptake regulator